MPKKTPEIEGGGKIPPENLAIRPDHLAIVREILRAVLPEGAKIAVFGSRARGTAKRAADLDLAIDAGRKLTEREGIDLSAEFEESDLPYKVDIVDMRSVTPAFKALIEEHNIPLPLDA